MTNQQAPAIILTSDYFFALMAQGGHSKDYNDALEEIGKQAAEWTMTQIDAIVQALNLEKAPPAQRLAFYRGQAQLVGGQVLPGKTLQMWDEQLQILPQDWAEDHADYAQLRKQEAKGEL